MWAEQPSVPRGIRLQAQAGPQGGRDRGPPGRLSRGLRGGPLPLLVPAGERHLPLRHRRAGPSAARRSWWRSARSSRPTDCTGAPRPVRASRRRPGATSTACRSSSTRTRTRRRALQVHLLRQLRRRSVPISRRRLPAPRAAPPGRAHDRPSGATACSPPCRRTGSRGAACRSRSPCTPATPTRPSSGTTHLSRVRDVHPPVPRRAALDRPRRGAGLRALGAGRACHLAAAGRPAGLRLLPERPQPLSGRAGVPADAADALPSLHRAQPRAPVLQRRRHGLERGSRRAGADPGRAGRLGQRVHRHRQGPGPVRLRPHRHPLFRGRLPAQVPALAAGLRRHAHRLGVVAGRPALRRGRRLRG